MFRMAFNNKLNIAISAAFTTFSGSDEEVSQILLDGWMQMKFRLLHYDG